MLLINEIRQITRCQQKIQNIVEQISNFGHFVQRMLEKYDTYLETVMEMDQIFMKVLPNIRYTYYTLATDLKICMLFSANPFFENFLKLGGFYFIRPGGYII